MIVHVDLFDALLGGYTTPSEAVDPHLAGTLRESFTSWVSARALTPIVGAPDRRFVGRLANRDVQIVKGEWDLVTRPRHG